MRQHGRFLARRQSGATRAQALNLAGIQGSIKG
jgi:hypothetical protein